GRERPSGPAPPGAGGIRRLSVVTETGLLLPRRLPSGRPGGGAPAAPAVKAWSTVSVQGAPFAACDSLNITPQPAKGIPSTVLPTSLAGHGAVLPPDRVVP